MAMTSSQEPWTAPDPMLVPVAAAERIPALTHALDRFAGRWSKLRDQAPELLDSLRKMATIESAGASTRIEGAQLSDEEVSEVLAGLSLDSFRARDEQEVRGYRDLLELVFESHAHMPVTENTILQMHGVLLRYSDRDRWHAGRYKTSPNHVELTRPDGTKTTVFQTAPPAEARWWMQRLVDEFSAARKSGAWHPLVLIADFIVWFLAIHPFQDGNGRLSRALTTLLLLQAQYDYVPYSSLEGVIEANKPAYYAALRQSQILIVRDPARYIDWLEFFLGAMAAQQTRLEARVAGALASAGLPEAQTRLLDAIRSNGAQTSSALASRLGMSERTARYHLANMVRAGRLQATRRTAGRLYSLPIREQVGNSPPLVTPPLPAPHDAEPLVNEASMPSIAELPSVDPTFQRYAGAQPMGRAYATVVVAAAPTSAAPLGDEELDIFDALVTELVPGSEPVRATPEVAWWHVPDSPNSDRVSMWLHPGPVIEIHWGLEGPLGSPLMSRFPLRFDPVALVTYWRSVLERAGGMLAVLGRPECSVAFGLQTVPSVGGELRDLDTTIAPGLRRTGEVSAPPPWRFEASAVPSEHAASPALLRAALDGLLRHYSYRRTDAAVGAILEHSSGGWSPDAEATSAIG